VNPNAGSPAKAMLFARARPNSGKIVSAKLAEFAKILVKAKAGSPEKSPESAGSIS
jgi:hypothetical protein